MKRRSVGIEKVLVLLKCVLRSSSRVALNLPPLKMFKSRNSMRSSLMLHVNLNVLCALFNLSRKLSSSWPYAQDVVDVALPDKRQDRFLGKEGPFESVHEQISIRRSPPCPHRRTLNLLVDLAVKAEDVAPKDYVEKLA